MLSEAEITRLDGLVTGRRSTRAGWVGGLVRRALAGREPLRTADKGSVAGLVKALRRIEAETARSAHMLAHLEATARECLTRLKATQRLHDKVSRMADALDALVRGNDSYWRSLMDDDRSGQAAAVSPRQTGSDPLASPSLDKRRTTD